MYSRRRWVRPLVAALAAAGWVGVPEASAQFLRIGPIDFNASASGDFVFTTNVEQQRDSDATDEQTDYFVVARLSLSSFTEVALKPTSGFGLNASVSWEKHFVRDDLDSDGEPLYNFNIDTGDAIEFGGRLSLRLNADATRRDTTSTETFAGGDKNQRRDVNYTVRAGAELLWNGDALTMNAGYFWRAERHEDEEFEDGDQDTHTINAGARWVVNSRISLNYSYSRQRTDLVNVDGDPGENEWEETQYAGASFTVLRDPNVIYSVGGEVEDSQGERGTWEPVHRVSASDTYDLTGSVSLTASANYSYEADPEEDDIAFTYAFFLNHKISRTTSHSVRLSRQPLNTLGSTLDTDSTQVAYNFAKEEFFIRDLTLSAGVSWGKNEPADSDIEPDESVLYQVSLSHSKEITRRLSRTIRYRYFLEDSNNFDENLDEHRVTIQYSYSF